MITATGKDSRVGKLVRAGCAGMSEGKVGETLSGGEGYRLPRLRLI